MASSSSQTHAGGPPRFIDEGFLELVQVIGTGAYGVVWLAIDSRYNQVVYRAVKALRRHGLDSRQRHFQRRELKLHGFASRHPSIIAMDRVVEDEEYTYVVMDYGEDGDLFAMICDRQRYVGDENLIRSVFLQLLDGLAHIHNLGIAHRDIKPENIVCSDGGRRVRICDFGLATSEAVSSEFGCGSTFYIAPECLGDWFPDTPSYHTKSGDVWSLGIILINLVCGRNPWRIASPTDESFNAYLKDPTFLRRILPISNDCLDILKRIFQINPADRISLAELRMRVLKLKSFSMSEEEVIMAHAAAQQQAKLAAKVVIEEDIKEDLMEDEDEYEVDLADDQSWAGDDDDGYESGVPFDLDDVEVDDKPPSLRPDNGSPSPPAHRSRSSSSMGISLPPTPLLNAEDAVPAALDAQGQAWGELFKRPTSAMRVKNNQVPTSPDVVTPGSINPFFRTISPCV